SHADVEIAVGSEDDAVEAALDVVLLRYLVRQFDARSAVGRTAGLESVDGGGDGLLAMPQRGVEYESGAARVGDQGDAIVLPQLIDQQFERLLQQRQAILDHHRA